MDEFEIAICAGVFAGNWLIVPYFFQNRTHKHGFIVGLLAAGICAVIFLIF